MTAAASTTEAPSRALFVRLGSALYGPMWQRELARGVGVSERAVRYWVAGRAVPTYAWQGMARLVDEKRAELAQILSEIPS